MTELSGKYPSWEVGVSLKNAESEYLEAARAAGIGCIELSLCGAETDLTTSDGKKIAGCKAQAIKNSGIKLWSIHVPFGWEWDISSPDKSNRMMAVYNCSGLIELCAEYNPEKIVIHPSYEPIDYKVREMHLKSCIESLNLLGDRAKSLGMQLAVESLPRTCLGNTGSEMETIINAVESVGVCCDMNHHLKETAQEFIKKVGKRITTVHISDYDGIDEQHWLPGTGVNNWAEIIRSLNAIGYSGPWMYEVQLKQNGKMFTPMELMDNWNKLCELQ